MKKMVPSLESTQSALKSELENNPELPHLSYIQAIQQTAGKGRQGSPWLSGQGNLAISILFDLLESPLKENLTWAPLWVGERVMNALIKLGIDKTDIRLKWPNDLYFQMKFKFGGILCEKVDQRLLIGIGLNVKSSPREELKNLGREVISIAEIQAAYGHPGHSTPTVDAIRESILSNLLVPFSLKHLKTELSRSMIPTQDQKVSWSDSKESHEGTVIGLGKYGELCVQENGKTLSLFSEEVRLKNP